MCICVVDYYFQRWPFQHIYTHTYIHLASYMLLAQWDQYSSNNEVVSILSTLISRQELEISTKSNAMWLPRFSRKRVQHSPLSLSPPPSLSLPVSLSLPLSLSPTPHLLSVSPLPTSLPPFLFLFYHSQQTRTVILEHSGFVSRSATEQQIYVCLSSVEGQQKPSRATGYIRKNTQEEWPVQFPVQVWIIWSNFSFITQKIFFNFHVSMMFLRFNFMNKRNFLLVHNFFIRCIFCS